MEIVKVKEPSRKKLPRSHFDKNKKSIIKPMKNILIDSGIYFLINVVLLYSSLFFTTDTSVAMVGVVWVGIIAWRGGVYAGLIGCGAIVISNIAVMNIPPHNTIPMAYYFNNRIPGFIIGFAQCFITGLIVGYISTLYHKLRFEIQLREKVQKDLENTVAELDAFGHTIAHDLKNPLMVINISIDSLINDFKSSNNASVKKKIAFINDGTKNMIKIIESILLLAGIKKIDPKEFKAFSISESVDDALKRLEFDLQSHDVQVVKPGNWPAVIGYAPWITEVWVNYISNAIKYGGNPALKKKPVIELGYDKPGNGYFGNSDSIRFWVKDNGEGIAQDKIGALFKEFSRLQVQGREGNGLGLSIAKSIIDKCTGSVGVESDAGKGSLFYFTLPSAMEEKSDKLHITDRMSALAR